MSEAQAVKKPLSATAIRQDGYDRLAFASAVTQVPELRKIARSGSARDLLSDVHASLFKLRPKVLDAEQTQSAHRDVIAEAMDTQEYARLRATTRMDELASALGTVELGTALAAALPDDPPGPAQDPQDGSGDPGAGPAPQAALKGCSDPDGQRRKLRAIVGDAADRTEEKVEAVRALMGPGCGTGDGSPGSLDLGQAIELAKTLERDPKLEAIAKKLGRLRRIASGKRRTRPRTGPDDVVDVELGNDLGSLLPSELQALGTPELEEVALLRFAQRRMLQVRRESKERENRGPMVVLVDESGSMSGEREIWAKAVTLALLGIAEQERRDFALVGFNNRKRVLRWGNKPGKSDVLAWLASKATGGTSFRPALDAGMRLVEEAKAGSAHEGADLILITDADDNGSINADWRKAWSERAEATGAHLYVVYVQSDLETFNRVADGYARLWNVADDGSALDLLFGI